jgi:hypothetical protein
LFSSPNLNCTIKLCGVCHTIRSFFLLCTAVKSIFARVLLWLPVLPQGNDQCSLCEPHDCSSKQYKIMKYTYLHGS